MNRIRIIRRSTCLLAALACAVLSSTVAIPAALADILPPLGGTRGVTAPTPPQAHAIAVGGMPGWQIALIASAAAVVGAVMAVLLERARASRRHLAVRGA